MKKKIDNTKSTIIPINNPSYFIPNKEWQDERKGEILDATEIYKLLHKKCNCEPFQSCPECGNNKGG